MCASVTACKRNGEEKKERMVEIQVRQEWKGARLMEQRLCKGSCSVVGNGLCTSKIRHWSTRTLHPFASECVLFTIIYVYLLLL